MRLSAQAVDAERYLFTDGDDTVEATCPSERGCFRSISEQGWLLSERILAAEQSTRHYVVTDAGPELLYIAEPMSFHGVVGDAVLATQGGSRLVRVPIVPGAEPETLYEGSPFVVRTPAESGLALLQSPSALIWHEDLIVVDLTASDPAPMRPPLLPGRTVYGTWTAGGIVNDDGLFLVQGESDETRVADVAWVRLRDGVAEEPILVSTGALENKIEFNANFNPVQVSPGRGWVALKTRLDPDGPSGTHVVPRNGDDFGDPVALGEATDVVRFSSEDDAVFFWSFSEDAVALRRTWLSDGALGDSEVLLELEEPTSAVFSDDGSMLVFITQTETEALFVLDLSSDSPSPWTVPECGRENIAYSIAPDGSFVACSHGEDRLENRSYALVDVRAGEVIPLPEATDAVRFGGA